MRWNELRRLAVQNGWTFDRHGSRHNIYRKEGRDDFLAIERHWPEEVRPKLLKRLLKQINDEL